MKAVRLDPTVTTGSDGLVRCSWPGSDPLMRDYHDHEWGRPHHDDASLFALFLLETFQAGLSWSTILHKRDAFARDFHDFSIPAISAMTQEDEDRLAADPDIIRNRAKIHATVSNARLVLSMEETGDDPSTAFADYVWSLTDGHSVRSLEMRTSPLSDRLSKDMRKRGFRFVGSVTLHSFLQAAGVINSHQPGCFAFQECEEDQKYWGKDRA